MFEQSQKRFFSVVLVLVLLISLFSSVTASAQEVVPYGIPNPEYPGTTIAMEPGDVLYSSKSLGGSSPIVGHVGIVGTDFRVYHVNPVAENGVTGGKSDDITTYRNRHASGQTITIYKLRAGASYATNAANWAKVNYSRVTNYSIPIYSWEDFKLSTINPNYCSKFLWQAFYYGNNRTDYVTGYWTDSKEVVVPPYMFADSSVFAFSGTFTRP
ncbi:hypothetical protein ACFPES_04010 [Paenibacillus sp. GCM10023248]|uniref:hypothetical protein n=1 Tax=unclassified Paenibacillus TaxID=185978 RepID=UPI0023787640|nr:hypothetical protein [Paenibacillus sp. MAHUQ-63]MDD9266193.1 hypothetical protein [Paenibacillus sp. MAHUQ-63]